MSEIDQRGIRVKQNSAFGHASITFVAAVLYLIFCDKTGFTRHYSRGVSHSWPEVISRIPIDIGLGFIVAFITYLIHGADVDRIFGCVTCGKTDIGDGKKICACGGEINIGYTAIHTGQTEGSRDFIRELLMKHAIPCHIDGGGWSSRYYTVYVSDKDAQRASELLESHIAEIGAHIGVNYRNMVIFVGAFLAVVIAMTFLTER